MSGPRGDMDNWDESSPIEKVLDDIYAEWKRARAKFPGPNCNWAALIEEVGELAKALMEEPRDNVRKEAIQVAAMAIRVILEGDPTMDKWRFGKDLDNLVAPYDRRRG